MTSRFASNLIVLIAGATLVSFSRGRGVREASGYKGKSERALASAS